MLLIIMSHTGRRKREENHPEHGVVYCTSAFFSTDNLFNRLVRKFAENLYRTAAFGHKRKCSASRTAAVAMTAGIFTSRPS